MEIKETKIREKFKYEFGMSYHEVPMKYVMWRKDFLIKLMEENEEVKVIRDDPESYPDKSKRISPSQAIW
jgi:hypothetical protein